MGAGQPLYGFIVGATIGKGSITWIDTESAERAPGVKMVMTHHNAPAQGVRDESIPFEYWRAQPVLTGPDVHYYGEPVALVVATTLEQARAAADLVEVEYTGGRGRFNFAEQEDEVYIPKVVNAGLPTDTAVGDFDAGFAGAAVKVDQQYTTPYELSMPMEPHACLVEPRDEDLTVYVSCQIVDAARASVAATLRIDPERVHVVTPSSAGIRLQAGHPFRDDPGRARRTRVAPTGQGRDDQAADLPARRQPPHIQTAGLTGRGAGRTADRDRP